MTVNDISGLCSGGGAWCVVRRVGRHETKKKNLFLRPLGGKRKVYGILLPVAHTTVTSMAIYNNNNNNSMHLNSNGQQKVTITVNSLRDGERGRREGLYLCIGGICIKLCMFPMLLIIAYIYIYI